MSLVELTLGDWPNEWLVPWVFGYDGWLIRYGMKKISGVVQY